MPDVVLMTTADLLDAVRLRLKSLNRNDSDYEAARILGVTQQTVSGYRTGKHYMGDEAGLAAALFLELEQEYVLACLHLERAKSDPARSFWRALAERLARNSTAANVAFLSVFTVSAVAGLLII